MNVTFLSLLFRKSKLSPLEGGAHLSSPCSPASLSHCPYIFYSCIANLLFFHKILNAHHHHAHWLLIFKTQVEVLQKDLHVALMRHHTVVYSSHYHPCKARLISHVHILQILSIPYHIPPHARPTCCHSRCEFIWWITVGIACPNWTIKLCSCFPCLKFWRKRMWITLSSR